jgi:peptidyl-prolyl cis-trans isomerase-like 3
LHSVLKGHSSLVRVIDGMDTLDLLEKVEVSHKHRPLKEVGLKSVTIHANPLADENISISS